MENGFLDISSGRLHYWKWGDGPGLFIALHGFEGDGRIFKILSKHLEPGICLYALDLPWHGKTIWTAPGFSPAHFKEMIQGILDLEGKSRFTAIGFSYGGRLWLGTIRDWLPQLERLVLLAPDGLASRGQLWTAIMPAYLRRMMGSLLRSPEKIRFLSDWLYKMKLLPHYGHRFLQRNLQSEEKRECLIRTWNATSGFPVRLSFFRQPSLAPVHVVVGTKDPLIRQRSLIRLLAHYPLLRLHQVHAGHEVLRACSEWVHLLDEGRSPAD